MSTEDKSSQIIAVSSAMISVMLFAILVRFYTRIFIVKWVGVDDTLIIVAASIAMIEGIMPIVATKYGLGKHHLEQKPEWVQPYTKVILASSLSYSASAMFIKLSLLAFYLRLAPNNPVFRTAVYVMIFVAASFGIGSIMSAALQCIPISMLWDTTVEGSCININTFYFANSALNIITDMIIYILPIPILWKLQLPVIQRVGLCAVLGLGGLVVVASIIRITSLRELLLSPDITWNIVSPLNWSTIELDIAIFATCVPAFKACIRHHLPSLLGTSRHGTSSRTRTKNSRLHSIPLGSVVQTEYVNHDGSGGGFQQKLDNKTTTTVTGAYGLGNKGNESEEFVLPKQGITQSTEVRVDYESEHKAGMGSGRSGTSSFEADQRV